MVLLRCWRVRLARERRCSYNERMTRDEALAKLRPMESELRARGLAALYLFGSVARNEAQQSSDVDLLCEVVPTKLRGIDFFVMQDDLATVLQAEIDFVERDRLDPRIRSRVEPDLVRVF